MYDLIIVGSGPASLTAAIYGARAELSVVLIEQPAVTAEEVDWPGDPYVKGPELMQQFRVHASAMGVAMVQDDVADLDLQGPVKAVSTRGGERYEGRAAILAPGIEAMALLARTGIGLDDQGYIIADADTMATNLDGVFAAGDARRKFLRQTITAAADGAIAACSAERYITQAERFEQEVLAPEELVLAVFWSAAVSGSLDVLHWAEQCAAQADGAFRLARIDLHANARLARRFGVTEAPSVLLLQNGEVVDRLDANFDDFCHWLNERTLTMAGL